MKHFPTRLGLVAAVMIGLSGLTAGCSAVQKVQDAYEIVTSASVSPKAVVIAVNSFNALEATATNYLRLRRCTGSNGPVCRDPAATVQIVRLVRSGRVARNDLLQFMRDHPGALGPKGLYDALISASDALRTVVATYNAK